MKKAIVVLAALFVLSGITTPVYAAAEEYVDGAVDKLVGGVIGVLTGWVELPMQIYKGYNEGFMGDENNKIVGAIAGIFDGIGHSAGRTLTGAGDIAGFWAANPKDNEGIGLMLDAEYAWEEGTPYNAFEPNFEEGAIQPIGSKLLRGAGNMFLGVAEIPGQIAKGISNKSPDLGIIKGIWYFYSREVEGAKDIATFILPGPKETTGVAFDQEHPWDALSEATK